MVVVGRGGVGADNRSTGYFCVFGVFCGCYQSSRQSMSSSTGRRKPSVYVLPWSFHLPPQLLLQHPGTPQPNNTSAHKGSLHGWLRRALKSFKPVAPFPHAVLVGWGRLTESLLMGLVASKSFHSNPSAWSRGGVSRDRAEWEEAAWPSPSTLQQQGSLSLAGPRGAISPFYGSINHEQLISYGLHHLPVFTSAPSLSAPSISVSVSCVSL